MICGFYHASGLSLLMSSWFGILKGKPDHPMSDVEEAGRLLADLPEDNPFKALEEITSWLVSVKDTPGFQPERRAGVIMLLDETGQPFHEKVLQQYLAAPHLQDFQGMHLWQGIHGFMKALAEAYALCVQEYQQEEKRLPTLKEWMPLICVRLMRAVAEQMKLDLMRYIEVEQSVWEQLYRYYNFAVDNRFSDTLVFAYSKRAARTDPQRELLRAALLYVASPATLAPDQIEMSCRIAARLASLFDFKETADPDCPYFLDLSKADAPGQVNERIQTTSTMRFFGAVRALPNLEEIINENEQGLIEQERRFGDDSNRHGKLAVLKHLQVYWGKDHPHRHQERKGISTAIEVVHGFKAISKLVARVELGAVVNLSEEDAAKLKAQSGIGLADEEVKYTTETWNVLDVSVGGIGGVLPKNAGAWVKIGSLCGVKAGNSSLWWVGMIRRLHTDHQNNVHVGIEILAKKPLSVWLRSLGRGTELASNWETSSGSFEYSYLPIILLPDAKNSYVNATMLMETGNYIAGHIHEAMLGEGGRNIKLASLLAEGEDYEQVKFQWLTM